MKELQVFKYSGKYLSEERLMSTEICSQQNKQPQKLKLTNNSDRFLIASAPRI